MKLQLEQLLASTNSSIVEIPDKEDKDSKNNEEDEEETELDKAVDKAEQPPDLKIDEDAADQEMDKDEVETANPLQLTEQNHQHPLALCLRQLHGMLLRKLGLYRNVLSYPLGLQCCERFC